VVGLSGQLIPGGEAARLVIASWATQAAPLLGFTALAILASVVSRNSVVGIGVPVVVGLVMQIMTLLNMPESIRAAFLATPFSSWHGFWTQPAFYGPLREGLITSAAWIVSTLDVAWVVFRFRGLGAT
jgi:ABC-2 type transport system permease protein